MTRRRTTARERTTHETEHESGCKLTLHVTKVDNRRDREYGLQVQAFLSIPRTWGVDSFDRIDTADRPVRLPALAAERIRSVLPQVRAAARPVRLLNGYDNVRMACRYTNHPDDEPDCLAVGLMVNVSKPSLIPPSQRVARDVAGALLPVLVSAAQDQRTAMEQARERAKVREQAQRLASHTAKEADKRARAAVRFKQRLAALVAELEAEQQVQLAELTDGAWLAAETADDDGWLDAAKALAVKHAADYMPSARPGRGLFGCSADRSIPVESVTEAIEAARAASAQEV